MRRLCVRCKENRKATPDEAKFLGVEKASVGVPKGCASCVGTGYKGRIGLFETLWLDSGLSSLIAGRATEEELKNAAGDRLKTLREDARDKVLKGIITLEEASRATMMGD